MLIRIFAVFFLLVLLPLAAVAQEEKTIEQLDKEIQDLKGQVETLRGEISDLTKAADDNKQQLTELIGLVREQSIAQQTALSAEALNSNMQSDEFRYEMQRAVHNSLQEVGTVIIRNKMATDQRVTINQEDHVIPAGESLTLNVPVGTLTARLPGQPLTNWTITAPTYKEVIDIVPSETVTAYRPIDGDTTTVYRPSTAETVVTYRPIETTTVTTLRPLVTPAPVYVPPPVQTYFVDPYAPLWWWPF